MTSPGEWYAKALYNQRRRDRRAMWLWVLLPYAIGLAASLTVIALAIVFSL
jgi:hypothetical protein